MSAVTVTGPPAPTVASRALMVLRVLVFLAAWIAVVVLAGALFDQEADYSAGLLGSAAAHAAVYAAGVLALAWLFRRFVDRKPWRGLRLSGPGVRPAHHGLLGVVVGMAMITVVFLVELALGFVEVTGYQWRTAGLAAALGAVLVVCFTEGAAGFTEEVAWRGYVFQNVAEQFPVWVAWLPPALVFALIHADNSGFGPLWVLNVLVLVAFLVATRLATGSLWFAIGWHAAWNIGQYGILGLGNVADPPEYRYGLLDLRQTGPSLLVGEGQSIEGGLIVLGVVAVALVVILVARPEVRRDFGRRLDPDGEPLRRAGG